MYYNDIEFIFLEVRSVNSTISSQMHETVIDLIQNAIVEGTDEKDIRSIIQNEFIRNYDGI